MSWLSGVEVVMNPDKESGYQFPGRAVAGLEDIREVERSPQRLVWWIESDTWARYVVHCCARYHNVVSFSTSIWFLFNSSPSPFLKFFYGGCGIYIYLSQVKTPQLIASRISCARTRRDRIQLRALRSQRHPPPTATFPRTRRTILMRFPRHHPMSSPPMAD
jgi:hypothetical protein